jgi:hypothetical protein
MDPTLDIVFPDWLRSKSSCGIINYQIISPAVYPSFILFSSLARTVSVHTPDESFCNTQSITIQG